MWFRTKLRRILEEYFPPPDKVELLEEMDGRFTGVITSKRFRRKQPMNRHNLIHKFLSAKLTPKEMSRVLLLVALTPEEERVQRAIHDWSDPSAGQPIADPPVVEDGGRFRRKLLRILKERFPPPAMIQLRHDDGIIGTVTSKKFRYKDGNEIQEMFQKLLKARLTPEEERRVCIIVGQTPEHEKAHRDDDDLPWPGKTLIAVPKELVSAVRELIASRRRKTA
jgi:stress-induced morphogen